MKYDTILEAAHAWVNEMDAIPQGMIAKLMACDPDEWMEVTAPAAGNSVYVFDIPEGCTTNEGEIVNILSSDDTSDDVLYEIRLYDEIVIQVRGEDFEVQRDDVLPMWGTMWSFHDPCDNYWLNDMDSIRKMSECGFRVYEHEEWGYFFGIDGAGYDFYEAHWIPLYKARGLRWHKEQEVVVNA